MAKKNKSIKVKKALLIGIGLIFVQLVILFTISMWWNC